MNPFDAIGDDAIGGDAAGGEEGGGRGTAMRTGPLIAFLLVLLAVLAGSWFWFMEPFPQAKRDLLAFAGYGKQQDAGERTASPAGGPRDARAGGSAAQGGDARANGSAAQGGDARGGQAAGPGSAVQEGSAEREWDYYIQIASNPSLPRMQAFANRYRRMSLPVTVESEYVRKKVTYRVRIGPFASPAIARVVKDSLRAAIPGDAFVDSMRVDYDAQVKRPERIIIQPEIHGKPPRGTVAAQQPPRPGRGFGVQVSSHRDAATAAAVRARLLARGLPAFQVKSVTASGVWHRVLLGPFPGRAEAQRYQEKIRTETGNDAFIIDFSKQQ